MKSDRDQRNRADLVNLKREVSIRQRMEIAEHFVFLSDLATDLGVEKSNLRKYAIRKGFEYELITDPDVPGGPKMAMRLHTARAMIESRIWPLQAQKARD